MNVHTPVQRLSLVSQRCLGVVAAVGLLAGCGSSGGARPDAGTVLDAARELGPADATTDLPPDADPQTDTGAATGPSLVRIAHLGVDLPPVDYCVAAHGTTDFDGPLLGLRAHPDAGGGGGVSYGQVSAYLPLAPGAYDVRLVAAGSSSCAVAAGDGGDAGTFPDATNLPAFAAGAGFTLLAAGELTPAGSDAPFRLAAIRDDLTLPNGGAALRAVNAVPSLPAGDFGLGSFAGGWLPLFTAVAFGGADTNAGNSDGLVDAQGYLTIAPTTADQTFSVRASAGATADVAVGGDAEIDLGSTVTVFAFGGKTGDADHPPSLLSCIDSQPSGGQLSNCRTLPPPGS